MGITIIVKNGFIENYIFTEEMVSRNDWRNLLQEKDDFIIKENKSLKTIIIDMVFIYFSIIIIFNILHKYYINII